MSNSEPNPAPEGGGSSMMVGVAWMIGFRMFDRVAGIVSMLVLARLLLPEHFGVVALASAVVAFIEVLSALGLDTILIQHRDLTRAHYDTAWTIQLGIALGSASILSVAAWPAAVFFHEPRLQPIIYALAFGLFLDGVVNIRIVDFRRGMRFDKEFLFLATRRVVAVVATISSALVLRNEWALAIGIVSSRATGAVMSYVMQPYRPHLSLAKRHELLGKSTWLFLSNIVFFARQRASDFAIGRLNGTAAVGNYSLASDLANIVSQELVAPINRVALPDLSGRTGENAVRRRFDLLTGQLGILLAPLCLGLSACAGVLIPILFGPAWAAAANVLRVLAVAGLVAGLAANVGVVFLSQGHYRANAWIHAIGAVTLVPLLIALTILDGPRGAAMAVLIANSVTVLASLLFAKKVIGYGPLEFAARLWRPIGAGTIMYVAVELLGNFLAQGATPWPAPARLGLMVAFGAAVYGAALLILVKVARDDDAAELLTLRLIRDIRKRGQQKSI